MRRSVDRPRLVAASLLVLALGLTLPATAREPIDLPLAMRVFQEAGWISSDDGGRLWGKALCGPILLADPARSGRT